MVKHRKTYEQMSKIGKLLMDRERDGRPLPPSMQRGTIQYVKSKCWNSIKQRVCNSPALQRTKKNASYIRKGLKLFMSKEQFDSWVERNWPLFEALYKAGRTPSVDRINNANGYTDSNLQVIDLRVNMAKDRQRPVVATNVVTGEVRRYDSATLAELDGFIRANISAACYRKRGSHRGWRWTFA